MYAMGIGGGTSAGRLRLVVLGFLTALFMLIPTAQAAAAEFSLTIESTGGSGTFECEVEGGLAEPCEDEYLEDTELSVLVEPDLGFEFVEWEGDCGPTFCDLTMDANKVVVAVFEEEEEGEGEPSLTIDIAGSGSGTVECEVEEFPAEPCEVEYPEGTELILVAAADPGSKFVGWSGDCSADPCEILMDEAKSVTATFDLEGSVEPEEPAGGSPTPTQPPVPLAFGKVRVSGAALFQGGKAALRLSCKGQGPCKGRLKLVAKLKLGKGDAKQVEIGKASFSLAAATSTTLKVKLSGAAKKELGKAKAVRAKVSGTGVTKSTVTIQPTAR